MFFSVYMRKGNRASELLVFRVRDNTRNLWIIV